MYSVLYIIYTAGWMKNNNEMTGSSEPCLKSSQHAEAWANYYIKYIQSLHDYSIDLWGLTVQNEPLFAAPWEACHMTAEEQRDFIRDYLGPALKSHKLTADLKLFIYDHNKDKVTDYSNIIMADSEAAQYVYGVGVHWYSGDEFDNLEQTHTNNPDLHILGTEACICPLQLDSYSSAEKYVHDIIGDLNHYASGWTDWNIVLDSNGGPNHLNNLCTAGIIADTKNDKIMYQPSYYAMAHFSRFLPPGSIRVSHSMEFGSEAKRDYAYSNQPDSNTQQFIQPDQGGGNQPWQSDSGIGLGLEWVVFNVDPDRIKNKYYTAYNYNKQVENKTNDGDEEIVMIIMNPTDQHKRIRLNAANSYAADIDIDKHSILTIVADAQVM